MRKNVILAALVLILPLTSVLISSGQTDISGGKDDMMRLYAGKLVPEIDPKGGLWYDDFQDLEQVNLTGGLKKVIGGLSVDLDLDDFERYSNNTDLIGENGWVFHNLYGIGSFIADNRTGHDNSSRMFARATNPDKLKNQVILSKAFDLVNGSLRAYIRTNHIYPDEKVSSRLHILGSRSNTPTFTTDVVLAIGFNNGGISVLSTGNWYLLTNNVKPNTWYRLDIDWNGMEKEFDIKVHSTNGTTLADMKDLNFRNPLGSVMRLSLTTGFKLSTQTYMETSLDDIKIKDTDLLRSNTALSRPLTLPKGCRWTTLRIDHRNAQGAFAEFELLSTEGRSLMNLFVSSEGCESELNYLNNEGIREVRFFYTCSISSFETPLLKGWGLEWEAENTWKDSFLTQKRTNGNTTALFIKGSYTLNSTSDIGLVSSRMIVRPDRNYWKTIDYDGYSDVGGYIAVDILDGLTGTPIAPFTDLQPGSYDISSIDYEEHQYLKLRATLISNGSMPILRSWALKWGENKAPEVISVTGPKSVLRTYPCLISVHAKDMERPPSTLKVLLSCIGPVGNMTMDSRLSGPTYNETKRTWDFTFTPDEKAPLGHYSFVAKCTDEVGYESLPVMFNDVVEVKNNPPKPPLFELIPRNPTTMDDIRTVVSVKASDREGELLTFSYRWFVNGKELKQYSVINDTRFAPSLPMTAHKKGDVVKFEVKVNDGLDWSEPYSVQTTIVNSPIKIIQNFPSSIVLLEDTNDEKQLDLGKIFYDDDGDPITYENKELVHSKVKVSHNGTVYIEPDPDWFGTERMVFNASDGLTSRSIGIDLMVRSVNDEPVARLLSPVMGTVHVKVGESVVFRGEAHDNDMDDLTFTWKEGSIHLGAGERIALNWTTPGVRTVDCHISDGYVDLVYSRVVVNVTKRPVIPGSGGNETGISGKERTSNDKLAFYLLPAVAFILLIILVMLAYIVARNKAKKEGMGLAPSTPPEAGLEEPNMNAYNYDDLQILGLEPTPMVEELPQHEVFALPPTSIDETHEEGTVEAEVNEDTGDVGISSSHPDGETIKVPSMESVDLQAELDSIEDVLKDMLGPKVEEASSVDEGALLPTL